MAGRGTRASLDHVSRVSGLVLRNRSIPRAFMSKWHREVASFGCGRSAAGRLPHAVCRTSAAYWKARFASSVDSYGIHVNTYGRGCRQASMQRGWSCDMTHYEQQAASAVRAQPRGS
jgi:hypothetical protein